MRFVATHAKDAWVPGTYPFLPPGHPEAHKQNEALADYHDSVGEHELAASVREAAGIEVNGDDPGPADLPQAE
jgi:hypothetical protein